MANGDEEADVRMQTLAKHAAPMLEAVVKAVLESGGSRHHLGTAVSATIHATASVTTGRQPSLLPDMADRMGALGEELENAGQSFPGGWMSFQPWGTGVPMAARKRPYRGGS